MLIGVVTRATPPERRSQTVGLVAASGSLGTMVLAPVGQSLIDGFGWQAAMLVFAAIASSMVLFALPIAAGLPQVIVYLSLAGALAAALAALAASMVAAAAILSEDVVHGLPNETVPDSARVGTARLALLGVAFVTVWLAIAAPADPLQLLLRGEAIRADLGDAGAGLLAKAGHDVLVLERKAFPREKTCGDGLTPRAVYQLDEMGLSAGLEQYHRYEGLRALAHGITLEMQWPDHPRFPSHGYVVRRRDLDQMVADHAVAAGARLRTRCEALTPLLKDGLVRGAVVKDHETGETEEITARYVVVADGANSRFGRALGTARDRSYPQGMALRGYYESPLHDDPWIESAKDAVSATPIGRSSPVSARSRVDLPQPDGPMKAITPLSGMATFTCSRACFSP
mgnify:CR=1 FL=1